MKNNIQRIEDLKHYFEAFPKNHTFNFKFDDWGTFRGDYSEVFYSIKEEKSTVEEIIEVINTSIREESRGYKGTFLGCFHNLTFINFESSNKSFSDGGYVREKIYRYDDGNALCLDDNSDWEEGNYYYNITTMINLLFPMTSEMIIKKTIYDSLMNFKHEQSEMEMYRIQEYHKGLIEELNEYKYTLNNALRKHLQKHDYDKNPSFVTEIDFIKNQFKINNVIDDKFYGETKEEYFTTFKLVK